MYSKVKRLIDVTLSLFVLVITLPLLLLVAILIKLDSNGPVLFKQERIGKNGKPFWMYKFRSMHENSEKTGSGQYSFQNDPRVTKVGRIIRKTSIDELPQLINIIKGDMAIIGPRPPLTYHPCTFEEYNDEQKKRFSIRPGVTGLAQINGRKELDWQDRIDLDNCYIENLSFKKDLIIFIKTVFKVLLMQDNTNVKDTTCKMKTQV